MMDRLGRQGLNGDLALEAALIVAFVVLAALAWTSWLEVAAAAG